MIRRSWVEKQLSVDPSVALAWADRPENAALVKPRFRHILIRVRDEAATSDAEAKKRIDAVLFRLRKGEDFAAVAAEVSEDPGSAKRGGASPGEEVKTFVPEVRTVYEQLSPGQMSGPVRSPFGWHIIRKDAVTDETKVDAYRRASAATKVGELANDLLSRFRRGDAAAQQSIDAAIERLLGERAAADDERPRAEVLAADTPRASLIPDCAAIFDAGPNGGITEFIPDEILIVGARAAAGEVAPTSTEPGALCIRNDKALTPAQMADQLRRLIDGPQVGDAGSSR
jgi:hypothetical protein